jgi:uncharacterized protein (TIGR02001 family)
VRPWSACTTSSKRPPPVARIALALATLAAPARAAAEVRTTVAIASDERFRGRSVSEGRPVVSADVSYDAPGGAYVGVTGTLVAARHDGPEPLALQAYAGYAARLPAGPSLDLGVTHSNYTEYYGGGRATQYTELYAGLITSRFASHLYYSPNYFGDGYATLYGELDTAVRPARGWRLSAHAGVLNILGGSKPPEIRSTQYDWRLGLATAVRSLDVELSWSGAGPDRDYYGGAPRSRSGVSLRLSRTF